MPWVWEKDIRAVRAGLCGRYGGHFDDGVDRLTLMITRRRFDRFENRYHEPDAIAYDDVSASARVLITLSNNAAFSAGVIALTAALLPKSYLREFPSDVEELRGKIVFQREKHKKHRLEVTE